MNTSKLLGALLLIGTIIVAVLHIYFGYFKGPHPHLAFALPVTALILAICALGFWLGWIMVTTKEPTPTPSKSISELNESEDESGENPKDG